MRKRIYLTSLLTVIAMVTSVAGAHAATLLFPDLKTLPPRDLRFETTDVDPEPAVVTHNVLRFSNTVWNAGKGPLELRGQIDPATKTGTAIQRVYNDAGGYTDFATGNTFYWHAAHQHYHFDNWGRYELWTKSGYEAWLASGRTQGNPTIGSKTTSCVEDEEFMQTLPNMPYPPVHSPEGCFPDASGLMLQGLSPGWGDTYDYYRPDQWIDLGANGKLADGAYVLRSVVDPLNKVYESGGKSDPTVEGEEENEAITNFSISGGKLVDSNPPTGTIRINDIDSGTASPNVTVKVLGRDDISGVTQVKLSNNGSAWSTPQSYTGTESTAQPIAWDLTNATYGGTSGDGVKTVYAQFKDASGKWSSNVTDTIELNRAGGVSAYSNAVLADGPAAYWRLGETSGTTAKDLSGGHDGTYVNGPVLGQAGLLAGDTTSKAVLFDGSNDYVRAPTSETLSPTNRVSVEAWIKPSSLPASGNFTSIVTKPESYSLQFNGPKLEFTIIQNGTRKRLQAPAGTIATGQAYHVVGTFDGTTQRLYVNGAQVAQTGLSGAITTNNNNLYIGSWDGTEEFFKGVVDDVAVYPSVLSASRVSTHYKAGSTGSGPEETVNAPSDLLAVASSSSQINLTWTDNSSNEGEFVIERDTTPQFTAPIRLTAWANSTNLSDTGLAPKTTYYYRVKAKNATNSSGYSNTAMATTLETTPPPTGYSATVTADSPVSYWRLGESSGSAAADERGVNPGAYLNSPTLGAASLLATDGANRAVGFDGVNDYVKVPSSATLAFSSAITVEAWIKPSSLPASGNFTSIVTKPESYSLQFNGPKLEFTIIQNGTRKRLQAPAGTIATGQAYHVVGTYDGTTQRLYVNGAQVAQTGLSGAITTNNNPLYIGSWDGTEEFFAGTIDDVAVYGSTLSAARVSAHYQSGSGSTPPPPPPPSSYSATVTADSPVSYWRLGESSGSAAADERGVNPGAYVNSPTLGAASLLASDSANRAVGFDGVNDNVRVPAAASLAFGSAITVEAWIKPSSLPANGKFTSVVTKPESYSLQFNGPKLEFTIIQNGVRKRLQPSGAMTAGQTYHVVGTYDGTTQRLYVNGAQVAQAALSGAITTNNNPLYIGSWDGTAEFFKGTIDDVAVYGSALGAARIAAHYSAATTTSQTTALESGALDAAAIPASATYSIASAPTIRDYCLLPGAHEDQTAFEPWRSPTL